jgi:hypothetical protein
MLDDVTLVPGSPNPPLYARLDRSLPLNTVEGKEALFGS